MTRTLLTNSNGIGSKEKGNQVFNYYSHSQNLAFIAESLALRAASTNEG